MTHTNTISLGGVNLIIGKNAASLVPQEIKKNGYKKPLLVTDHSIMQLGLCAPILSALEKESMDYVLFSEVPSDPPSSVVSTGTDLCRKNGCDSVIGIGGGSVLDCAKAIKMMATHEEGCILDYSRGGLSFHNPGLPLYSVPTTSGTGSEVTQYAVITDEENNTKVTIGSISLVSRAAFLDPFMTKGLPPRITAATALYAMAHAIEAYTSNRVLNAEGSTAFSDVLDLEAVRLLAKYIPAAVNNGSDLNARKQIMVGATMAGLVSQAGSGAAHGFGTALGAMYHVPHGEAVGIFLPYVMEYNISACPERFRHLAKAMGVDTSGMRTSDAAFAPISFMKKLLEDIHFSQLKNYVKTSDELTALAREAIKDHCCALNAIVINTEEEAIKILKNAW